MSRKIRFELPTIDDKSHGETTGAASIERAVAKLLELRDNIDNGENDDCLIGQLRTAALGGMTLDPLAVVDVLQPIRDVINDAMADILVGRSKGQGQAARKEATPASNVGR